MKPTSRSNEPDLDRVREELERLHESDEVERETSDEPEEPDRDQEDDGA